MTPETKDVTKAPGGAPGADGAGGDRDGGGKGFGRSRACRFCADEKIKIDYKDVGLLRYFVTDRGKLVPRRISGCCARHQREIATAVRRARMIALVPFTATGT
jgi:small subunit ribosomal protein S18